MARLGAEDGDGALMRMLNPLARAGTPEDARRYATERYVIAGADPPDVITMEQAHEDELRPWRLGAQLFALPGIIALIVATFGMYSAMAYVVSQRTRELGVRIALGAQRRRIVTDVVASGVRPLAAGLAIGLSVAIAFGSLVETMLYATTPRDPLTLAAVSLLLLASGVGGMLAPTYRALRVDPMTALRAE